MSSHKYKLHAVKPYRGKNGNNSNHICRHNRKLYRHIDRLWDLDPYGSGYAFILSCPTDAPFRRNYSLVRQHLEIAPFQKGFPMEADSQFRHPGNSRHVSRRLVGIRNLYGFLSRILGSFLIIYVIYLFAKSSFKIKQSLLAGACGGALSGFFAGLFGMGGAIRGLFLTSFDLPKAVYIATAGAIALTIDTTRLATYIKNDARLPHLLLWGLLIFVPASFLGAKIAKSVVDKIPQEHFRKVVAAFLLIMGIKLLLFSV